MFQDKIIVKWREYNLLIEDLKNKKDDEVFVAIIEFIEELILMTEDAHDFHEYGKIKEIYYACEEFLLKDQGITSEIIFPAYTRN